MSEEQKQPRKRKKLVADDGEFSFIEQMRQEDDARPWWQKAYKAFKMYKWIYHCTSMHVIGKNPYFKKGANQAAFMIKDDIEFGYDLDMIYSKIMHGNYGNDELPAKRDWFSRNGISWDNYLDKNGTMVLGNLKNRIEYDGIDTKDLILEEIENMLKLLREERAIRQGSKEIEED